ncbi:MAG: thermonuclease family protein [Polyangiaceae bacterium]
MAEAGGGFVYDGRRTRAFVNARVGNKVVVNARGQVTVRLQGIDAPELHYRPTFLRRAAGDLSKIARWNRSFRQPLGEAAACALGGLVANVGVGEIACIVRTRVDHPGDTFDMYGRFIGDVFVRVGHSEINLNHWLAQHGWAFPAFYDSMQNDEIEALLALCEEARHAKRGVWARVQPALRDFTFRRVFRKSETEPPPRDTGAVCMPKLFRRMATWRVLDAAELPSGSFRAFLKSKSDACYETAAFMNGVGKRLERASLDAFVTEAGRLSVAPEKLVFLEAPSSLRGKRDELVRDW